MKKQGEYKPLCSRIQMAGFFTAGVEDMGAWNRLLVCSRYENQKYCGNSFWVSSTPSGWFIGAWGGSIYRVPSEEVTAGFCVEVLKAKSSQPAFDFDLDLVDRFGLKKVPAEEFEALTN